LGPAERAAGGERVAVKPSLTLTSLHRLALSETLFST
jgi:hypothetical protein